MTESNRPQRNAGRPAWHRDMVSLKGSSSEESGQSSSCRSNISVDNDLEGVRSVMNSFADPLPPTQSITNATVPSSPPTDHNVIIHLPLNDDQQQKNMEDEQDLFDDAASEMQDRQLAAVLQGEEFKKANQDSPPVITCSGRGVQKGQSRLATVDAPCNANQMKEKQHDVAKKITQGTNETGALRFSITPPPNEAMLDDTQDPISNATEGDRELAAALERREMRYPVDSTSFDLAVAPRDVELVKLQKVVKNLRVLVTDTFDQWNRRLIKMEAMLEQLDGPEFPCKPDCLPIRKLSQLTAFENLSKEEHAGVVYYLSKLGGSNVNECANIMLKEALHDRMAPKVNYYGRHEGTTSLEKTKFVKVLYRSMARNRNLRDVTMDVFANATIMALRAAKQRRRNVMNRRRGEERQGR